MELKDTIEMMQSEDYKERFKAEYYQINIRLNKLKAMLKSWDEGTLSFEPICPREIYDFQVKAMEDYRATLVVRAAIEKVPLEC